MPNTSKSIVINGKFLTQKTTGVQRFALEIVRELDKIVGTTEIWELAVPFGCKQYIDLERIKVRQVGLLKGILWEQVSLALYALRKRALCVSLCNMHPLLAPHVVAIHDASFKANPSFFSKPFMLWYSVMFALSVGRMKRVLTVSEFSKGEISKHFKINPNKIDVVHSAWTHFNRIDCDENFLSKSDLAFGEYYFALGSMAPGKNFKWIAKVAYANPDDKFAVAGTINKKVFGDNRFQVPANMLLLGCISDSQVKALMKGCKAFLFPSLYEGFGLPPLEALSVGAPVIVSNVTSLPEIYGDSVHYIDPLIHDIDLRELLKEKVNSPVKVLSKYDWAKTANQIYKIIKIERQTHGKI
jgi:glycosyltransferase involved in cell wall biosynthesis